MPYQLKATTPDSLPEIVAFLRDAFQVPADSPNLNPRLLQWKYYEPGPDWEGSRSYVIRKGEALAAHSGVWPIRLATRSGCVQALQAVDWAGARSIPGAGSSLMKKLRGMAPVLITVGGSADTQRALPVMGFKVRGQASVYARVLRPWRQFRTRQFDGLRAFPRLGRNALWSRSPLVSMAGWTSEPSAHPDVNMLCRFGDRTANYPESRYNAGFLEFMLSCPAAKVRYFELSNNGNPQGYFVMSRVGGQARLADLRILSEDTRDWIAAYAAAVRVAAQDPAICELATSAFVPVVRQALEANGFQSRGANAIFVLDPGNVLGEPGNLHLSMLDDDSAYLNHPGNPYCT